MQPLAALLLATLNWLSPATREIVIQLSMFQGIRTDLLAQHITMRSRYQVARLLDHAGSRWGEVRSRGVVWVLIQLRDRCVIPTTRMRSISALSQKQSGG
jgi:hypothetical protein